jgi:hypothetical protein
MKLDTARCRADTPSAGLGALLARVAYAAASLLGA